MDKLRERIDRSALKNPICLVICFFAGAAGSLPYFWEPAFIATFVSYAAFFAMLICRLRAKRKIFLPCFLYFLGFYIPVYSFLSELYPFARFGFSGGQAVFVLICACVLIPAYHALLRSLILLLLKAIPKNFRTALTFSFVFLISELITTVGTLAFPWANVAVSLTGFLPYLQTVSMFGVSFITLITAAVCFAAAKIFTGSENIKRYLLIALAVLTVNTTAGAVIFFIPVGAKETVSAALIQGNISSNDKWEAENREAIFEKYVSLTREAAEKGAKLIVLPESAIPLDYTPGGRIYRAFSDICDEYDAVVIMGVMETEDKTLYNSVIGFLPDGSVTERYDKRHPVPFGEFIPFADIIGKLFPFVKEFNENSSDYGAGDSYVNLNTSEGVYGPVVCFDSIFPQFTREAANNGAEALVVVTNDSWFEDSVGIYTHLRHAQLRAIENRKSLLRAANTGISAIISQNGKVEIRSEALKETTVYYTVALNDGVSLYSRMGDVGVFIIYTAALLSHVIFIIYKRSKNGKNKTARK